MERRAHPRYKAADRVCVTALPKGEGVSESETFYCTTDDLSADGLRFSGRASFEKGQILDLLVVRGHAYWGFSLKGRVAWVKKGASDPALCSFGIEFTEVPEQTRLAWREAIERASETPAGARTNADSARERA